MNRLQKKCFFAATGVHLLLALILLVGPAFLSSHSKTDDLQTIDIIPANLIDGNFAGGGEKNPAPPPAAPPQPPQTAKTEVQTPVPAPKQIEQPKNPLSPKVEVKTKSDPESLETKKISKPPTTKPNINTQLVTRKPNDKAEAESAADAKRRADLAKQTARILREGLSSATTIDKPQGFGGGGEAYASYALVVKSVYEKSWIEPTDTSSDEAAAKVTVTIARDGTVISARISQMSGDEKTDASIQRTLDRVKFIAPFPAGTTDKERTYIINFNLKAKRLSV